jgi:hypothetical protein
MVINIAYPKRIAATAGCIFLKFHQPWLDKSKHQAVKQHCGNVQRTMP